MLLLYPLSLDAWEARPAAGGSSESRATPSALSRPLEAPAPRQSPTASDFGSPATVRRRELTPSPPHSFLPPPWRQGSTNGASSELSPAASNAPAPSAHGDVAVMSARGSLLDQYYATQSSAASAPVPVGKITSDYTLGGSNTSRIGGTKLLVPLRDHSQLESPPESDEENPSVELPHSAQKFVQRPTQFADPEPELDEDDGSNSIASTASRRSLASRLSKPLASQATPPKPPLASRISGYAPSEISMAPSTSNSSLAPSPRTREVPPHIQRLSKGSLSSGTKPPRGATGGNLVPLGQRVASAPSTSTLSTTTGSKQAHAAKPRTAEYQVCPCHACLLRHPTTVMLIRRSCKLSIPDLAMTIIF